MPPSKKARAKVKTGMRALDISATTHDVKMTMGKANPEMTRRHRQNSFQDTCHAAS